MRVRTYYMFLKALLITFLCFLVSCQKWMTIGNDRSVPNSIASADEQKQITAAISEIQDLATTMGISTTFKSFPVVVLDKSLRGGEQPQAFCKSDRNGNGVYVAILKKTLEDPSEGYLFLLLVHEFGHCLYNRNHDSEVIQFPGIKFYYKDQGGRKVSYPKNYIPVSSMNSSTPGIMSGSFINEDIKRYYLSEMIGGKRWKTIADLENAGIALKKE